jgi:hypothetical protein
MNSLIYGYPDVRLHISCPQLENSSIPSPLPVDLGSAKTTKDTKELKVLKVPDYAALISSSLILSSS